jgi:hypothetical protein
MSKTTLNMQLLLRRAEFAASCVLAAGEPGYHTSTKEFKIGDGSTTWENLPIANKSQIDSLISSAISAHAAGYYTKGEVDGFVNAINAAVDKKLDKTTYDAYVEAHKDDYTNSQIDNAISAVDAKFGSYTTTSAQETIDAEQNRRIKAIEDDYLVEADIANFETKANVQKVADDLAAYVDANDKALAGVKATAEAARTEEEVNSQIDAKITALNLGTTYEPIGAETRAKGYVDQKFVDANLDQYTTEQEVKNIVDSVIAAAADSDTYNSLTKLVDYIDTHGGEAADMAETIEDHEERLQAVETKPAIGITEAQIENWDTEVGAKALAESKTTTAEVKTQIEAYGYATTGQVATAKQEAISDAASKYETIGTAQGIVDSLKLGETYEPIGAESKANAYTDKEISDFNTETVAPIAARVKAIEDAPYTTKKYVDDQDAATLEAAKAYADGLDHEDTTYTVAATANALEFTVTPDGKGSAQTIKLVAPVVDTGVMKVSAGKDIVVTPAAGTGEVTVAHKEFTTGAYTKDPATSDKTGDVYMMTGVTVDNGHVTGANVQSLAHALMGMTFIFDGGTSAE